MSPFAGWSIVVALLVAKGPSAADVDETLDLIRNVDRTQVEVFRAYCAGLQLERTPSEVLPTLVDDRRRTMLLLAFGCSPLNSWWAGWPLDEDLALTWFATQRGVPADTIRSGLGKLPPGSRHDVVRKELYSFYAKKLCAREPDARLAPPRQVQLREACSTRDRALAKYAFGSGPRGGPWSSSVRTGNFLQCKSDLERLDSKAATVAWPACACFSRLLEASVPSSLKSKPWEYEADEDLRKYCIKAAAFVGSPSATAPLEVRAHLASRIPEGATVSPNQIGTYQVALRFLRDCESPALARFGSLKRASAYCYCAIWGAGESSEVGVLAAGGSRPDEQLSAIDLATRRRIQACTFATEETY